MIVLFLKVVLLIFIVLIAVEWFIRRFVPKAPPGTNICPRCGERVPYQQFSAHWKDCA